MFMNKQQPEGGFYADGDDEDKKVKYWIVRGVK